MLRETNKMLMDMNLGDILSDAPILEKVFYNENILEQIFKFLPIKELVTMRRVSRKWKSESDRALRLRRTLITLRTEDDIQRITDVMDGERAVGSTPLFRKFLISFDQIHLEQEAVVQFLNSHGRSIEQLSIQFVWTLPMTQNTPESLKTLLEKQVPNLKSLQFFGFSEELWQSGELFNDSVNLLPHLKHIGCITVNNYRHAFECPLYLSLFNRLPSVKTITINCSNYWDILFNRAVSANGHQLRKFLSEVEEINTAFYGNQWHKILSRLNAEEELQPFVNLDVLKLMPQVCPKVKALRLCYDCRNITNGDVGNVILKKYAGQIEELWLNVNENLMYMEEETLEPTTGTINSFFTTSVFPKLRVIHTQVDILQPSNIVTQIIQKQLPALESLSFHCHVPLIVYNRDFQHLRLRELQLITLDAERLLPIGQTFPSVKNLSLDVSTEDGLQSIALAFPNLEELTISCLINGLSDDGIKCIGDLHHLRRLTVYNSLSETSTNWLKQLKPLIFLHTFERSST